MAQGFKGIGDFDRGSKMKEGGHVPRGTVLPGFFFLYAERPCFPGPTATRQGAAICESGVLRLESGATEVDAIIAFAKRKPACFVRV